MKTHDFIVVGSGIAGLSFALRAAKHGSVAIVTKKGAADTNTAQAQGGIACVRSEEDSFDRHVADTLDAGAGLCPEDVVRTIVSEGPRAIDELIAWGVDFDSRETGDGETELDLGREGGHTKRRILHSKDTTGREIETKLLAALRETENVTLLERHFAIDLITTARLGFATPPRCVGIYVLNEDSGEVETLRSDRVVLCTGGCGRVYIYTTNPSVATGDGVAMAWRAGVEVANMEFVQFHPTCLYHREVKSFLITEAMRGEGAVLRLPDGTRFMPEHDERAELAPRDVVARAIDFEMKKRGLDCVFLDITHKPAKFIVSHFPTIHARCLELGLDITREWIPVAPAAHYTCGGVVVDQAGRTDTKFLYAIGETTCTGLHGANRLASNSLLECLVYGRAAAADIAASDVPVPRELPPWDESRVTDADEEIVIAHNWHELRRFMWDYVGIVRTNKRLERAKRRVDLLRHEIEEYYGNFRVSGDLIELRNLVEVADLIIRSAALRHESRGLHYSLDYPPDGQPPEDTVLQPQQ
ncbi:MAG: L-aspartate oxidase [Chromatiales bacterium]|nr:L-aspartate oxidase [Chromatiales bacterium]